MVKLRLSELGRQLPITRNDQANGAIVQSRGRLGVRPNNPQHLSLTHHGMVAPQTQPGRLVSAVLRDGQPRRMLPADYAQRSRAGSIGGGGSGERYA